MMEIFEILLGNVVKNDDISGLSSKFDFDNVVNFDDMSSILTLNKGMLQTS